jgi:hypothetical protein
VADGSQQAFGYAEGGFRVFVDGIVGPWFVDPFVALARSRNAMLSYIVLRPSLAVTLRRARGREGLALRDTEPLEALHRQFSALGAFERTLSILPITLSALLSKPCAWPWRMTGSC